MTCNDYTQLEAFERCFSVQDILCLPESAESINAIKNHQMSHKVDIHIRYSPAKCTLFLSLFNSVLVSQ